MKSIIILFVDAFGYSYINERDTPFLYTQNVRPLTPVLGFKQLASAFGGPDPYSSGFLAEHYFAPDHSPYRWLSLLPKPVLSALDLLPRIPINLIVKHISRKETACVRVPPSIARFFAIDGRGFPESVPLLAALKERSVTHRFVLYPEVKTNKEAFHLLAELYLSRRIPQFLLIHFPSLDHVSHTFGTGSEKVREAVREIDDIIAAAKKMLDQDSFLLVFSDHGMVEVKGLIDVLGRIRGRGRLGKDFVVFLDSTMARFWSLEGTSLERIAEALASIPNGQVFRPDGSERRSFWGDLLFLASPGYVIYPNYYDGKPPKAMHGYDVLRPSESSLNGILFAVNIPGLILPEKLSMPDVYSVLKRAIESI